MCPFLTLEEMEVIVQFLYTGEICHIDQNMVAEVSKHLSELFGFPLLDKEANLEHKIQEKNDAWKGNQTMPNCNKIEMKKMDINCYHNSIQNTVLLTKHRLVCSKSSVSESK